MSATLLNAGLDPLTKSLIGGPTVTAIQIRLFVNNVIPAVTDVLANYVECTVPGYAAVATVFANWQGSTVGGIFSYSYPTIVYLFTAYGGPQQTVYGYVADFTINGVHYAVASDVLATAYPVPLTGGALPLNLQLNSEKF